MTPDDLFALFNELNIETKTYHHPPTFTVDEGRNLKASMPGGHSKNLFLKDKKGELVLISAHADAKLKLNQLHKVLNTGRLSFAPAELMESVLGVTPGSVTAFALANPNAQPVRFLLERRLAESDPLNFHPLQNDMTTAMSRTDFELFLSHLGRSLEIIDFDQFD